MSHSSGSPIPEQQPDIYAAHAEQLVWVEWEEEYTVYNRATGETHVLNAFPAEILLALSERPADVQSLAQRLAALIDVECSPTWTAKTADSIVMLRGLELVETLSTPPLAST